MENLTYDEAYETMDEIMSGEIRFFKKMCETVDFADEKYIFSKNTALIVREVCDTIRKDNSFLF